MNRNLRNKKSFKRILEWERFDEPEEQKRGSSGWGVVNRVQESLSLLRLL